MDQTAALPQPASIPSTPAASSFTAPEGSYKLLFELNAPAPGNASAAATPTTGVQLPPAPLVPEYPASLCTAVLYFPGNAQPIGGGTILGLGNSQRASKIKDDQHTSQHNNNNEDVASTASASTASGPDGAPSHQPWAGTPVNGQPQAAAKKKPLVSLPSLAAVPSVLSSSSPAPSSATTSKPKSAFRGTTSTFVKMYEGLPLSSRSDRLWGGSEAREATLAVFTTPRAVLIVDISPRTKNRENLARIAFSAIPTCIALNYATLSHDRMDVLVGFATGDVIWMEVFSGRYTRYNKDAQAAATNPNKPGGAISIAPVTKIAWLPGAGQGDNMFCTAHRDGCLVFWDKDREDPVSFTPNHGLAPPASPLPQPSMPVATLAKTDSIDSQDTGRYSNGDHVSSSRPRFGRGQQAEEYTDDIVVTLPQLGNVKNANRYNPAAHWKVSRKAITDFSISPDSQYVAVVSEDGCLRIIDANSQKLLDTFQAYFGGLTCVAWSPDGRFLLTGGQDDLACVWSPFEQRIVARCEGHSSFLTGLSFDAWRCDNRAQRFASVSEDCRLIFWDLSSAALQRPKGHLHQLHHSHGHSGKDQGLYSRRAGAASSLSLSRKRTMDSSLNLPATAAEDREGPLWHTAPNRSEVAGLQPVMSRSISNDLLSGVVFLSDLVVTISRSAIVRVFARPESRL